MARQVHQASEVLLSVEDANVFYDQTQVLFGVDVEIHQGEILALLGTNGAGKSTLLKAISGLNPASSGRVVFEGADITRASVGRIARLGIAQVPGGRGIFPSLTIAENLKIAAWMFRRDADYVKSKTAEVLEHFPALERRWSTAAGSLSGGEQQMVSLAQAFLAKPKLLLIDELSLGLAPTIVEKLLDIVRAIHAQGTTVVVVEQSVTTALRLASRAVFMEKGEVRFSGATAELLARPDILRSVFIQGATLGLDQAPQRTNGARAKTAKTGNAAEDRAVRRRRVLGEPVVLETVGLTKNYGAVTAVSDVDIQLHRGEILGLVGANGAGKTTIFDLISGLVPRDAGRVEIDGEDVTDWPAYARARRGLSRSFQDARLWPSLTVADAIAVALGFGAPMTNPLASMLATPSVDASEREIARRVEEVIELMGLGAFRDKFVSELSTGSRRMVEIASLLADPPTILLLDEPSSGIAQRETEALGSLILQLQSYIGCSILIIEHDMPLVTQIADHLIALELGGVVAHGTPDEVLTHPQVIASYLGDSNVDSLLSTSTPRRARRRPVAAN
jgi:branched-chain amino acid transport system ATP-binding protein